MANELQDVDLLTCSHWGLFETEAVCAIGAVGKSRGTEMAFLDPEDADAVARAFGIASVMAQEIVWVNDEAGPWRETPEQRFARVRKWVVGQIRDFEVHQQ